MKLKDVFQNNDKDETSWREDRRRFVRWVVVPGVIFLGVAVLFLIFEIQQRTRRSAQVVEQPSQPALERLVELKRETEEMNRQLEAMVSKHRASDVDRPTSVRRTKRPSERSTANAWPVVNYDPRGGFSEINSSQKLNYIPRGAVFLAQLITPIKTSISESFVLAETTNEYRMDSVRRIPKGSRLIGGARLNPILKGVIVRFNTIVKPDGEQLNIDALALNENALPELQGLFFSDKLERYSVALAFGFISGLSDASRTRESTIFGPLPRETTGNRLLSGLSTASFQVAENLLRDIQQHAVEYVVVPAGDRIFVALQSRFFPEGRESSVGESSTLTK